MVERPLSNAAVEAGEAFLEKLDDFGLLPESAAWVYSDALDEWRYLVATSGVDTSGRRAIYRGILDVFDAFDFGADLTESDVQLVSPNEDWYALLRQMFRVKGGGRTRITLDNCKVNGILVNAELVIYRFGDVPSKTESSKRVKYFEKKAKKAMEDARR